jgi:hypothetical protein
MALVLTLHPRKATTQRSRASRVSWRPSHHGSISRLDGPESGVERLLFGSPSFGQVPKILFYAQMSSQPPGLLPSSEYDSVMQWPMRSCRKVSEASRLAGSVVMVHVWSSRFGSSAERLPRLLIRLPTLKCWVRRMLFAFGESYEANSP